MRFIKRIKENLYLLNTVNLRIQKIQESLGRIEARQLASSNSSEIQENEFKVYSQWGEDGIIQFLLNNVQIKNKIFVEFGVENYTESNTRFLLINDNWSGLILDGDQNNIDYIKKDRIYWQYNLKAECSFVTKDNINDTLARNGISGEIGILSIDIDGNDYWVWDSINIVTPAIVITEYNAKLGSELAVTIPYDPCFVRSRAHHSMIYYGASLKALCQLGNKKGYCFVGCNSAGNNAFFVRRDLLAAPIKEISVSQGFVQNKFRESRDNHGILSFLTPEQEYEILNSLQLINVEYENADAWKEHN